MKIFHLKDNHEGGSIMDYFRNFNYVSKLFFLGIFVLTVFLVFPLQSNPQKKIENTDPAIRLKWYKQHVAMKETSIFKDLKWRFIGPDIISGRCTERVPSTRSMWEQPQEVCGKRSILE